MKNGSCRSEASSSHGGTATKYYDSLMDVADGAAAALPTAAPNRLMAGSNRLQASLKHFSVKVSDLIAVHTGTCASSQATKLARA